MPEEPEDRALSPAPERLTRNFLRREFICRCGCDFGDIDLELVQALQALRNYLNARREEGQPEYRINILSGCRCPKHNQDEGGAEYSQHVLGRAADIVVPGMSARAVYVAAKKILGFRGFGVDDARSMVHLDTRQEIVRWCYRDGKRTKWFEVA